MRRHSILAMTLGLLMASSTVVVAQNRQVQSKGERSGQTTNQENRISQHTIRDANRDGQCDICKQSVGSGRQNAQGKKADKGKHWGPGDGTGLKASPPKDGSGYGSNSGKRTGPQDGTQVRTGGQGRAGGQPNMAGTQGRGRGRGRH